MKISSEKKEIALVFVMISFCLLNFASATDTEINVKTLGDRTVSIYVLDASQTYYLLESYHLATDWRGFLSVTYSGSVSDINVRVVVKEDKTTILSEKFGPYKSGSPIYIQAIPGNLSKDYREFEKTSPAASSSSGNVSANLSSTASSGNLSSQNNSSLNATSSNLTENTKKLKNNTFGGFSFIKIDKKNLDLATRIIIALVLVAVLIIILKKYGKRVVKYFSSIRPPHLKRSVLSSEGDVEIKLKKAEKKLEEAQREIERIKREEKIKEVKKRLQEDLEELKRLKRGE